MTETREAVERLRRNFATTMTTADALETLAALDAADARVKELEAENARLREAIAVAAVWTAVPGTTIAEIRAALEGRQP